MHEIVTLQIGEAANYLGTHFWNVQESYFTYTAHEGSPINHDVHFRPGIGADGSETFTPRTLIYDFKPRFGTLRRVNELYAVDANSHTEALANPTAAVHRHPQIPAHDYQHALADGSDPPQLTSNNVRYWSDYNRVFYSPKSIVQIHEDELGPQQTSFSAANDGEDLYSSLNRSKDLLDEDFRPLIEECNQMQGIQILASVDDGWGGFTSRYLDDLRDEYGKSFTVVWALQDKSLQQLELAPRRTALCNEARSLASIGAQADLYLPILRRPLRLPTHLQLGDYTHWQSSALQCCAMDTLLLPTRLRQSSSSQSANLDDLLSPAPIQGRRVSVAALDIRLQPYGSEAGMTNGTSPEHAQAPEKCDLSPFSASADGRRSTDPHVDVTGQLDVLRGSHLEELMGEKENAPDNCRSFTSDLAFPCLDSFPRLYMPEKQQPSRFSMRATTSTNSLIPHWIRQLQTSTRPYFSLDEREGISNELQTMAEAYQAEDMSNDDSDDS